jgi:hypothetical protein
MALGRLTSFTFGNSFLTLVYANSQTYYVSYAHIIAGESDSRSGDLTIWIYTAGEVGETLSVKNSDLVAIGSSATAFLALFNQNIQPYSYWQDFLDSTTASGALPSEPSALRGQCLYARFRPIYNFGSASLINVPARFKAGTLYSQVPDTGAGDFTVTRATTPTAGRSTRINKDGLIELVADNVPRLDYPLGGAVNGCPALLVEPSAQNLVPNGVGFTSLAGVQTSSITDSPAVAISGTLITKNEASGTIRYTGQNFSASALVSSTTYTISRFFKYNGVAFNTSLEPNSSAQWGNVSWNQAIVLSAASGVTLGTSTLCTGSVENYGNGWYRVNVRVTTGATISPQLETGSVATSYIPTTTQAITRGAETISKTGVSSLIGQTEGTIYAEFINTFSSSYNDGMLIRVFADANNEVFGRKEAASNRYTFRWRANSQNTTFTNVNVPDGVNKVALAYKSGDTALFLNGVQIGSTSTDVRAFSVNPTTVALGSNGGAGQFFNDRIRAAALYPNRLSNSELIALTTP